MLASSSDPRPPMITPSVGNSSTGPQHDYVADLEIGCWNLGDGAVRGFAQCRFRPQRHQGFDCSAGATKRLLFQSGGNAEQGQQNRTLERRAYGRRSDGGHNHQKIDVKDVLLP